jgi:hypothetical protein
VSTVAVLFALLAASYAGAFLLGSSRRRGLASGASWILVGLAVGPSGLGMVSLPVLEAVAPLALVGIGWIGLVAGLRFGVAAERRVRPGAVALATAAAVAGLVLVVLAWLAPDSMPARERLLVAVGTGLACAELGRRTGDLAVMVGFAALLAFCGAKEHGALVPWVRIGTEIVGGGVLGALAAVLLRDDWRQSHALAALFGTSLVAIGIAAGLGGSALVSTFAMGVALSLLSRHSARLRLVASSAQAPVLIPVLLLAGAHLDLAAAPWTWAAAFAAVTLLTVAKASTVALRASALPATRGARARLAAGFARHGALGTSLALGIAIALPGSAAAVALTAVAAGALTGPVVGLLAARTRGTAAGRGDDLPAVEGSP